MRRRDTDSVPEIVEQTYQLWIWLDVHHERLPAHARAAIGARVLDAVLDLMDALLVASYAGSGSPERVAALSRAHRHATSLRFLLRGMHDRRHLSHAQHAHAFERLDEIGRRIHGWRNASR